MKRTSKNWDLVTCQHAPGLMAIRCKTCHAIGYWMDRDEARKWERLPRHWPNCAHFAHKHKSPE